VLGSAGIVALPFARTKPHLAISDGKSGYQRPHFWSTT